MLFYPTTASCFLLLHHLTQQALVFCQRAGDFFWKRNFSASVSGDVVLLTFCQPATTCLTTVLCCVRSTTIFRLQLMGVKWFWRSNTSYSQRDCSFRLATTGFGGNLSHRPLLKFFTRRTFPRPIHSIAAPKADAALRRHFGLGKGSRAKIQGSRRSSTVVGMNSPCPISHETRRCLTSSLCACPRSKKPPCLCAMFTHL